MFAEKKNNELAIEIKEYIESAVHGVRTPNNPTTAPTSLSDELQKLATLKDQGILTDEEFQTAKPTPPQGGMSTQNTSSL